MDGCQTHPVGFCTWFLQSFPSDYRCNFIIRGAAGHARVKAFAMLLCFSIGIFGVIFITALLVIGIPCLTSIRPLK
jgi:hypothetical protein